MGTALRMGSGYVPLMLGGIPDACWGWSSWWRRSAASTRRSPTPTGGPVPWQRMGLLVGSILFFGATVSGLGLGPSLLVTTFLAALAGHGTRPGRAAVIAIGLTALCLTVFVGLLQLRLCRSSATGWGADVDGILLGLETALQPSNILICLLGVTLGTAVGVLPGIGPTATVALLLPITFSFDPVASLIMLAGIYYGAQYGGSTTAILLNLPGESSAVVTALDGYQMAKQGRAGPALATAALGSFFAGTVATVLVALFAPPLASAALEFGPADYFSIVVWPARLDSPGQRVGDQGARHDRARAAARHDRAGPVHRRPALHVRGPRALRRAGLLATAPPAAAGARPSSPAAARRSAPWAGPRRRWSPATTRASGPPRPGRPRTGRRRAGGGTRRTARAWSGTSGT